jgi:hypothetical protein
MVERADQHRRLALRAESGSLATYVAAATVLPLLAMLAAAGVGLSALAARAGEIADARDVGVLAAEIQGGLTPSVQDAIDRSLAAQGIDPASVQISGTPAPAPWGSSIQLSVEEPVTLTGLPWNLLGLAGRTVTLGGVTYTTSNLAPSGASGPATP